MSDIVKNPFHNYNPEVNNDNLIDDVVSIAKGTVEFVGKLFKKRGYGQEENVGRIQQHLAIAAAAKAGMSKEQIAQVMTETSPTGTKFTADDGFLRGKTNEQIMQDALQRAQKYAAMTGTVLPKDAINQILGGAAVGSGPVLPSSSGVDPAFNTLIPLVPTMKKALGMKGIVPASRLDTLAQQFYNNIVVPNYGLNFNGRSFEAVDLFDIPANHADEVTDAIITGIVAYIQNLNQKAESGADLNKTEQLIYTGTQKAESAITSGAKSTVAEKFGESILFKGGWIWLLGGIVGIIVLILVLKK